MKYERKNITKQIHPYRVEYVKWCPTDKKLHNYHKEHPNDL